MEPEKRKLRSVLYSKNVCVPKGYIIDIEIPHQMCVTIAKDRYFLALYKKTDEKVTSEEGLYKKGMLFKHLSNIIPVDPKRRINFSINNSSTCNKILAYAAEEIEVINFEPATYETEYIPSKSNFDESKIEGYKSHFLELLDKIFNKSEDKIINVSDFSGLESVEELTNSIFAYLLLRNQFKNSEKAREYLEANDLEKRVNILVEVLNSYNYSPELNSAKSTKAAPQATTQSPQTTTKSLVDTQRYRTKINEIVNLSQETKEEILKKVDYLESTRADTGEKSSLITYIETILSIPWDTEDNTNASLKQMETDLEKNQFGMKNAKERILEYIATSLNNENKFQGPIICLIGSPGTGKTFFAKNVGKILNRKCTSIPLGGVDDVTILRGQRRGWVGAEPGQIVKALIRAKSMNPIIVLDEIDKISTHRGDAIKAALLEILDPNQNYEFKDAYLDIPTDISKIIFVATANYVAYIPHALRDRLEMIEIEPYTPKEKFEITERFVIPKVFKETNINENELKFDKSALDLIVDSFKFDGGMRRIEQTINKIARKYIVQHLKESEGFTSGTYEINKDNLAEFVRLDSDYDNTFDPDSFVVGVINALWVRHDEGGYEVGGGRSSIQVKVIPGSGKVSITGSVQEMGKESINVAISYIKSKAEELGVEISFFKKNDILIHRPNIAVKKDGPSSGLATTLGIISAIKNIPVPQSYGITGEIDLNGGALPIGGVKSKVSSNYNSGLRTFVLPESNRKDFENDVDESIKSNITVHFIKNVSEAVKIFFPDSNINLS